MVPIGGLVLLPLRVVAHCADRPYEEKREHYLHQNMLAASLHPATYDQHPGFVRFVQESGLPFRAHDRFERQDLEARQRLYEQLAEQVWSPQRVLDAARQTA